MQSEPIYKLRPAEVYLSLESSANGISTAQSLERQILYGKNILAVTPAITRLEPLVRQLTHPLAIMLWGAGGIAVFSSDWVLAVVIWALVILNAGFSAWRERETELSFQALNKLVPAYARLYRDSTETNIPASEIVPGDLLILGEGDQVPADARIVESNGLRINNAALTGESVPVLKTAEASLRDDLGELERSNLIFAGTSIYAGTGRAVVYATGMLTQIGRIAQLTQATTLSPSQLQTTLNKLTRRIALIAGGVALLVGVAAAADIHMGVDEAMLLALGVLAALIPEGLPANLNITLAASGRRLARQGVLVKQPSALEILGTISTICTDKSGTLTQNQMTVQDIITGSLEYQVTGVGYTPEGEIVSLDLHAALPADLGLTLMAALLCNNARLSPPSLLHPTWTSLGDQTEAAMRVAAMKARLDESYLERVLPRSHELPFDARRKMMTTIHRFEPGGLTNGSLENALDLLGDNPPSQLAFVKGAPRELLQKCTHILVGNDIQLLTPLELQNILRRIDERARSSMRILALAYRPLPARSGAYIPEKIEVDLVFLGLMAMMDPPRPEVSHAIKTCHQAGIRLIMVTGDYGLTAESVARRLGMLSLKTPRIINGVEFEELDDDQLSQIINDEVIFARMAPEHKLRLVAALQKQGHVVAVVGDGVNDAPALRKADLGITMGLTGTGVAKEAADIILVRDDFSAIIPAIAEGRTIYKNLRKVITYISSSNLAAVAPVFLAALLNIPMLLNARLILAIDLLTNMLPSIALGIEKPEPDIMRSYPDRNDLSLTDGSIFKRAFLWLGIIETLLALSAVILIGTNWFQSGIDLFASIKLPILALPGALRLPGKIDPVTLYFSGLVLAQAGNALACRTEINHSHALGWLSNRFLWFSVIISLFLLFGMMYLPGLASAFNLVPLPAVAWIWLAPYPLILYSLEWLRKSIVRNLSSKRRQTR